MFEVTFELNGKECNRVVPCLPPIGTKVLIHYENFSKSAVVARYTFEDVLYVSGPMYATVHLEE